MSIYMEATIDKLKIALEGNFALESMISRKIFSEGELAKVGKWDRIEKEGTDNEEN